MDIFRRLIRTHPRGSSVIYKCHNPPLDAEDPQIHLPRHWLWNAGAVVSSAPDCREQPRISLVDLPPELVYAIFDHADLPSTLALGLCSHSLYQLATSALNKTVIITQQNALLFLHRAERHSPLNAIVHRVQVGRVDRVGHAERWNLCEIAQNILTSFATLKEVDICGGTYIQGWKGLDEIGRAIGDRVVNLTLRLIPPYELSDEPVMFPKAQRLRITFMSRWSRIPATNLQKQLHMRFPNLRHLAVIPKAELAMDVSETFIRFFTTEAAVFSALSSFELMVDTSLPCQIQVSASTALIKFLLHHASTLRSLALPDIYPVLSESIDLSSVHLNRLSCGIPIAGFLANYGSISTTGVEELDLDFSISSITSNDTRSPNAIGTKFFTDDISNYSNTRTLTLRLMHNRSVVKWFQTIPVVLPHLTTLYLDFVDVSHELANPDCWDQIVPGFLDEANNLELVMIRVSETALDGRETEYKVNRDAGKAQLELRSTIISRPLSPLALSGRIDSHNYWSRNF